MAAQLQLVATGDVNDTTAPFGWTCTVAPNDLPPILSIHRPGPGQFNFAFNSRAFTGMPRLFVISAGVSGQGINNAVAYVRYRAAMNCSVFTTVGFDTPINTSFNFLIVEFFGAPLTPAQGIEGKQ